MTGSGTQANPYIVTTWEEFTQVFADAEYIELGSDIQASDYPVNIVASKLLSLDGKGHSITNIFSISDYAITFNKQLGGVFNLTIKDISFDNINCQGNGFIRIGGTNDGGVFRLNNVAFNGSLYCDMLINSNTWGTTIMDSVGGNIHTNTEKFSLGTFGNNSKLNYGCLRIDYGSVTPDSGYSLYSATLTAYNTIFEINAPAGGKIYFGGCIYCAFTGSGTVWIISASGINIVENTLDIYSSSTGTNYQLSSSDIRNIQVLYNLGFPVSGVV